MTRDDVIGMVREIADKTAVDPVHGDPPLIVVSPDEMIRFAKLAQAAEREACAKVCEHLGHNLDHAVKKWAGAELWDVAEHCAAAIRARGQA